MPALGFKKWPWNEVRMAVAGGVMTMQVAADTFGIPLGSITARSSREGWLKKGAANRVNEEDPKLAEALAAGRSKVQVNTSLAVDYANLTRDECRDRIRNSASRVVAKGLEHMLSEPGDVIVSKADKIKSLVDAGGKASGFDDEGRGQSLVVTLDFLKNLDPTQVNAREVESSVQEVLEDA